MITVKNISSSTVVLVSQDTKFHRKLAPGRTVPMSDEVYDELSFDNGFQTLISNGFIKVEGIDATQHEIVDTTDNNILSRDELKAIYEKEDITAFAKMIGNASTATKETAVELAVEMRMTKPAFTALIKKYCGVDIIQAIAARAE